MVDIIDYIFADQTLREHPPVLIDVGASGELHAAWKRIAPYSICVAFDPDNREMAFAEKQSSSYKRLFVVGRAVTDGKDQEIQFYLTSSPFCSSSLKPDIEALSPWVFRDLFLVEKTISLKAITLSEALSQCGLHHLDWLKCDTQGTDLRIFKSLPEHIRSRVVVAEFEPGILDAYQGEDKLHEVLAFMEGEKFFLSSMEVKGTRRISQERLHQLSPAQQRAVQFCLPVSPGWAEVRFINTLRNATDRRSTLLAIAAACLEKQFGFALELCLSASTKVEGYDWKQLEQQLTKELRRNNNRLLWVRTRNAINKIVKKLG